MVLSVGRSSLLVPPLLLRRFLLSFSFFPLLRGLRPGTGACILLSLSLLSFDDLTMPPYSPLPPPLTTPVLENVNTFFAESKCWALARSSLTLLFFFCFFSVSLLRDTDQVTGHITPHSTLVSAFFFSPFGAHGRLFFFFSFVLTSLTATFRFGQSAI